MTDTSTPAPQFFRTFVEMCAVPSNKIDAFCEDLRLALHMRAQVAEIQASLGPELSGAIKITSPSDAFGWVDDGRHDANIRITLLDQLGRAVDKALADAAVDPHVADTGTPTTRDKD